jgi:tetratricopeptide (TPR) repeat protein
MRCRRRTGELDEEDDELIEAMLAGGELTELDAQILEEHLSLQPDDLRSRMRLVSYLDDKGSQADAERIGHILWIVNNHPDLCKYVVPALAVGKNSEVYEQARSAWLEQLANNPSSLKILINAATIFRGQEDDLVLKILERAQAVAPHSLEVESNLANHYRCVALAEDGESAKASNASALKMYEHILSRAEDDRKRFYNLTNVATTAFGAGELQRAEEMACEMLRVAPAFKNDWNFGNAVYWSNIVLGKIAFSQTKIVMACDHLISASQTSGSPQLNSFGPEFVLCSQLANSGKLDCVRKYLSNCEKFWEMNGGQLSAWIEDLDNGVVPSFNNSCSLK